MNEKGRRGRKSGRNGRSGAADSSEDRGAAGHHAGRESDLDPDPEREVDGLAALHTIVADSSSLILAHNAGFLGPVCHTFTVVTVPEVEAEVGQPGLFGSAPGLIEVRDASEKVGAETAGGTLARDAQALGRTDAAVIALARASRHPVFTEDRKLSLRLDASGLAYYNALMMLCALVLRGVISTGKYEQYRLALLEYSRYAPRMLRYGEQVYLEALKHR